MEIYSLISDERLTEESEKSYSNIISIINGVSLWSKGMFIIADMGSFCPITPVIIISF